MYLAACEYAHHTQGITLKLVNNHLIIARVLFGGIIHRQGLLKVGDRVVEVNNESVDAMSPADFQSMMVSWAASLEWRAGLRD